jgi:hypothetical protein
MHELMESLHGYSIQSKQSNKTHKKNKKEERIDNHLSMVRRDLAKVIESAGGSVGDGVTRYTDYLLTTSVEVSGSTSKVEHARK